MIQQFWLVWWVAVPGDVGEDGAVLRVRVARLMEQGQLLPRGPAGRVVEPHKVKPRTLL